MPIEKTDLRAETGASPGAGTPPPDPGKGLIMTFRPTLLERAYQFADGGLCSTLTDITNALHAEGFTAMQTTPIFKGPASQAAS